MAESAAPSFRHAMAWVHTWFGLVLGYVLMACFFFGALSVFDREIDRWGWPDARGAVPAPPDFDRVLLPALARLGQPRAADAEAMVGFAVSRTHRDTLVKVSAEFGPSASAGARAPGPEVTQRAAALLDPTNGRTVRPPSLRLGTDFFYPMHYGLHLEWHDVGYWIVGLAALVMMVALVTGLVLHKRILREWVTFRPAKQLLRSTLDLHNLTGVAALPFHFFFAFTGLFVVANIYLPLSHIALEPLLRAHSIAPPGGAVVEPVDAEANTHNADASPLASVNHMVAQAAQRWSTLGVPGEVGHVSAQSLGGAGATVSVYRAGGDEVTLLGHGVHFDARSGKLLHEDPLPSAVHRAHDYLAALHLQPFRHVLLHWLYVLGGLAGAVCIATGFVFFTAKRTHPRGHRSPRGGRWLDACAVAAVTGMVLATAALMAATQWLPNDLNDRGAWQRAVYWAAWLATLLHAAWRHVPPATPAAARANRAWGEQCVGIAVLAVAAVAGNWLLTGGYPAATPSGVDWAVTGTDIALITSAALALLAARTLRRGQRATPARTNARRV